MTATFGAAVRVIIMQQGEPAMLNSQPRSPLGQCISDDIMVSEREREGKREREREGGREGETCMNVSQGTLR